MTGLTLGVLVDNGTLTDRYFIGEPGFSCYLECAEKKFLFDTGYSDTVLANAGKMGIDLLDLDAIVLSHGHSDHTGGLPYLLNAHLEAAIEKRPHRRPGVVAHPYCFYPRPVPPAGDIGCPVDLVRIGHSCTVTTTENPLWLTENLVFLGEIERAGGVIPGSRKLRTIITPDGPERDRLRDDSALAYVSDSGLVIITGCAHAGLENTVRHAQKVTGQKHVRDIIGGFHLMAPDHAAIDATVAFIQGIRPDALHPCHCTSLAAKIALSTVMPVGEAGVGLRLEY